MTAERNWVCLWVYIYNCLLIAPLFFGPVVFVPDTNSLSLFEAMAVDNNDEPSMGGVMAVLPNPTTPWYKQAHLAKLNGLILGLVCFREY